eukprot:CAMPEP_0178440852 /NCGR_PEP_ID=MMETSP0689_2-20121128/37064_1 /TAXON_ID=160604 /ORGANISM="Amphidinium massartii, Strain CS-259" /LENGTH=171 /DNA_ID=CAMNT_0020063783 /DNA_START=246 /DNA_END=758 /DNA_ORIENTATION=+
MEDTCCVQFVVESFTLPGLTFGCELRSPAGVCESVTFKVWNSTTCSGSVTSFGVLPEMLQNLNEGECALVDQPNFETLQNIGPERYMQLDRPLACFPRSKQSSPSYQWPWWSWLLLFMVLLLCMAMCVLLANREERKPPVEPRSPTRRAPGTGDARPLLQARASSDATPSV